MSISMEEIQDWEAELSVSPLKVTEGLDVPEENWRRAIYYDSNSMDEFLSNWPSYYHDRLHGFLVAYEFEFHVDEDEKLKATGSLYQATEGSRGDLLHADGSGLDESRNRDPVQVGRDSNSCRGIRKEPH